MGLRSRSFFDFIAETFFDVIFLIFPSTDFSEKSRIFRKKKFFFSEKTPNSNHVFLRWERSSALSRWSVVPNALSRSQSNHRIYFTLVLGVPKTSFLNPPNGRIETAHSPNGRIESAHWADSKRQLFKHFRAACDDLQLPYNIK